MTTYRIDGFSSLVDELRLVHVAANAVEDADADDQSLGSGVCAQAAPTQRDWYLQRVSEECDTGAEDGF